MIVPFFLDKEQDSYCVVLVNFNEEVMIQIIEIKKSQLIVE